MLPPLDEQPEWIDLFFIICVKLLANRYFCSDRSENNSHTCSFSTILCQLNLQLFDVSFYFMFSGTVTLLTQRRIRSQYALPIDDIRHLRTIRGPHSRLILKALLICHYILLHSFIFSIIMRRWFSLVTIFSIKNSFASCCFWVDRFSARERQEEQINENWLKNRATKLISTKRMLRFDLNFNHLTLWMKNPNQMLW